MSGLPRELRDLIESGPFAHLSTINADGSPQVTVIWIGRDGDDLLSGHMQRYAKLRNIERDPRVAVSISDPSAPSRYFAVRGHVVDVTTEGGAEHIEALAQRYLGGPYPWFGGRDQIRVIVTIAADRIHSMG